VNNKAAYLMTDGGTFNGYTINGLGISTVAKIYYEVQTNLLISGSDYQDLADALSQACQNLIGSVTTASDCEEVFKALNAVQMHSMPPCKNIEVPLCNTGTATNVWFDDLENTVSGNWIPGAYWYYPQNPNPYINATYATSGSYNIWGYDFEYVGDYSIAMSSGVLLPAGAYMSFNHAYDFERGGLIDWYGNYLGTYYFDGGVLEYNINGGAWWYDAKDLITVNGYKNKIYSQYGNPLGGRKGFTGSSHGYISSKLNLSSLAGSNVRFRFRIGTDSSYGYLGWFIDDIRIYTCSNPDPSVMVLSYPNGGETFKPNDTIDITWSGPSDMAYVALKYSLDNGLTWNNIAANITGTSFKWLVPLQNNNKRKCFIKVVGYDSDGVKIGSVQSGLFGIEVVKVTRPNGGESFVSGYPLDPPITWSTNDTKEPVAKVKLYLTKIGGTTWEPIGKTPGNPGSYDWTPQVEKQKIACKVKIELLDALGNIFGTDVSDNPFTIQLP
jgi:hypothetical protein